MLRTVRLVALLACVGLAPSAAWAQATLAGTVRDASGAVLPGVTVEASSPVLIEKSRTAMTDGTGQYRIESLQPGTYTVTFTLAGFSTLKRDDVVLSGTGVIKIDADLKVGGVAETVTVAGETPVVDVQSTRREVTLDNETMRNLPSVRSYSYLLTAVPGVLPNNNNVNSGPVFAIFPIHGGRGVESRLTVDGLNIGNPPGGNQPSNYVADIGNAAEVSMITSGGLGELETAGLTVNVIPKSGGNTMSGLVFASGFGKGMQSSNFDSELQSRGVTQPNPVYHVYDFNAAVGGPIVKDKLWYVHERPPAGIAAEHAEPVLQPERGQPERVDVGRRSTTSPAYSDRTWENYTPRITWQANPKNKFSFVWDEQPICRKCTGATSFSGSPSPTTSPEADGLGDFNPQRVQQVRWTSPMTNKLLLEAGLGTSYYQWAGKERDPNPTHDLVRVFNIGQVFVPATATTPAVTGNMTYRSQSWYQNFTNAVNWQGSASYVTGSHSMKFGYQGYWWKDDRGMFVNSQGLQYTFIGGAPSSLTEYINGYQVNARAADASFYAQDQWTLKRLTLQGAHPVRSSVELVPGGHRAGEPLLPRRQFPARRRRDRLQRHHPAPRRHLRSVRQRQDGAEGERREVPAGRQRQQPGLRREPGAADPERQHDVRRHFRPVDEAERGRTPIGTSCRTANPLAQPAGQRRMRPDRQPRLRQDEHRRHELRSGPALRLGRPSVRLVVRRVGPAAALRRARRWRSATTAARSPSSRPAAR